jgi:hypothetical protein
LDKSISDNDNDVIDSDTDSILDLVNQMEDLEVASEQNNFSDFAPSQFSAADLHENANSNVLGDGDSDLSSRAVKKLSKSQIVNNNDQWHDHGKLTRKKWQRNSNFNTNNTNGKNANINKLKPNPGDIAPADLDNHNADLDYSLKPKKIRSEIRHGPASLWDFESDFADEDDSDIHSDFSELGTDISPDAVWEECYPTLVPGIINDIQKFLFTVRGKELQQPVGLQE